jgi:hypothetical protein
MVRFGYASELGQEKKRAMRCTLAGDVAVVMEIHQRGGRLDRDVWELQVQAMEGEGRPGDVHVGASPPSGGLIHGVWFYASASAFAFLAQHSFEVLNKRNIQAARTIGTGCAIYHKSRG